LAGLPDDPAVKPVQTLEVAAGLIFRDGKLLITQRYPEAHLGGLWEFPGGKREPNETFHDCLERELKEELGIEVQIQELVQRVAHDYPEKRVILEFYRCKWLRNEPQALGCPDFCWVTRDKLQSYVFPEADTEIVSKLKDDERLWKVAGD
jgi:mutator protein MutT